MMLSESMLGESSDNTDTHREENAFILSHRLSCSANVRMTNKKAENGCGRV